MKQRGLGLLVLVLVALAVVWSWPRVHRWLTIDACLDRGGAWDRGAETCVTGARPGRDLPEGGAVDTEQASAILDLPTRPEPRPEDVASPEAAVRAIYASISGPAEREQPRDWDRLRSLFLPDARLVITRWQHPDGPEEHVLRAWDVEAFIEAAKGFYQETGFYEREIARHTDRFGNVAQIFTTYETRLGSEDAEPVARGINSVQVVQAEGRWWVAHLVWDVETDENPIPERHLPPG